MEKYFNLTYLCNNLSFGDNITLQTGNSYSVEQVHDRYLLDCYDDKYDLHTFDLIRLFLFEKIDKINDLDLPKFEKDILNHQENIKKSNEMLWLLISFDDLLIALKNGRILANIYTNKKEEIFNHNSWIESHFIKLQNKIKDGDYISLINQHGERLAYVAIKPEIMINTENVITKKIIKIFQMIDFSFIDKVYFPSQLAMDKFLGEARAITHDTQLTSKCIFDPYPLDEDLKGKW